MTERDEKLASLRRQVEGLSRQIAELQGESAEAGYIARGVPRGRLLPPIEHPRGPASELFSQVVPRNVGGGDGGAGGGGGGGAGPEYDADETYIHEDAPAPGAPVAPHVFQHRAIGGQPVPTTGSDIVRSGLGHINVTPVEHQVNPAGHIDTSKTGAIASHGDPDQAENEQDIGITSITDTDAKNTTVTVGATRGLAFTELTRIASAVESGKRNLYAFFRKWLADYKGHITSVEGEVKSDPIPIGPPEGDADGQILIWNNTTHEWEAEAAPFAELEGGTVPSTVIPVKNEGWIYKYTRAGVEEVAHADPRNETVYKPSSRKCGCIPAHDARGHCIGWWVIDGDLTFWESPWGFDDPGIPPG